MTWDWAPSPPLRPSGPAQASRELLPVREGGRDLLPLPIPARASQLEAFPQRSLEMKAMARVPWSPSRAEKRVNVRSLWSSS